MKPLLRSATLAAIIILAAVLRLWEIGWDLPYVFHPDEPVSINIALQIFRTGDLNPHFFDYPSLYFYLNALSYVPYFLLKFVTGVFDSRMDVAPLIAQGMGITFAPSLAPVLLSRLTTALFGLGSVVLIWFIGHRLTGKASVGLLAALMLAVSPANVYYGRHVAPDGYAVFFILACFAGAALIFRSGKLWHYVLAGCMAGFAASCKYNAGLIVLPIVAAHLLRWGRRSLREPGLYVAALSAAFGFLFTTPFAVLDYPAFARGIASTAAHYSSGHPGMEGDTLNWYLRYLWDTHGLIPVLAASEIGRGLWKRERGTLLLALYPVLYFAMISQFVVRNDRTILPLTPFLYLLAASLLVAVWTGLQRLARPQPRRLLGATLVAAVLLVLAWPLSVTVREVTAAPGKVAAKDAARAWMLANLPAGAHIAMESYAPFLPPESYTLTVVTALKDHPPKWYQASEVDYLVFSEAMFGRYYREPERYPTEVALYEELFQRFPPIIVFDQGGAEIRISKLLPTTLH